ncbi:MAG: penicillin-binding protein 1A [Acidiferrobacterales bacterium]
MTTPRSPFARLRRTAHLPDKPWQLALIALSGLFATGVLMLALIALVMTPTLPSVGGLRQEQLKVPMRVYTAGGTLIAEFGAEKRIPVDFKQIPPVLIDAILSAEDESFYYHEGIDFEGIVRAAWADLRSGHRVQGASTITMQVARNYFLSPKKTYSRKLKEMLLALKIEREYTKDEILDLYVNKIYLGNHAYGFAAAAQVYFGKKLDQLTLPEAAMLAGLPQAPSRDNPFNSHKDARGRRAYVLGRMRKLGFINRAAYDAAVASPLPSAPSSRGYRLQAPYVAEMVRQYMYQHYSENSYAKGYNVYTTIRAKDQKAANDALQQGLLAYDRRHGYRGPSGHARVGAGASTDRLDRILKDYPVVGPLLPAIVTQVNAQTAAVYAQNGENVTLGWSGLSWARRYISANRQGPPPQTAEDVVRVGDIIYIQPLPNGVWRLAEVPSVSGALVSLNPNNGAILALTGGFDFYQSSFNRVTQAERQPGSSFKPFVYCAALDKGFTAASMVSGAPIVVPDANQGATWRPENYERNFVGPTRLRKALALSLNLVSIRLLREITPGYAVQYLARFGFDPATLPDSLSLVLGSASVTPLQMVSAYAVFANGGYRVQPHFILRIEDEKHHVLEQANPPVVCDAQGHTNTARDGGGGAPPACPTPQPPSSPIPVAVTAPAAAGGPAAAATPTQWAPRVISADDDFIMTSMMHSVITSGTGQGALALGRSDIAGKTGTTNNQRDAWFSGFNRNVVTTVWVGFDQPAPLGHDEVGARAALPIWVNYMRTALGGYPQEPLTPPPGIVTATIDRDTGLLASPTDSKAMQEYFIQGTVPKPGVNLDVTTPGAPPPESVRQGLF